MSDPMKQAWQASASAPPLPPLDKVRKGADQFYRRIRRRNAIEYGAAIVVILVFSAYVFVLPSPAARVGSAMVVIGTFLMLWQFRRRASAVAPIDSAAIEPILIHQRTQLARQRDALSRVFTWYMLPFVPGLLVMIFGPAFAHGPRGLLAIPLAGWIEFMPVFGVFAFIWWLNQRAARGLDKGIRELDALIGQDGRT